MKVFCLQRSNKNNINTMNDDVFRNFHLIFSSIFFQAAHVRDECAVTSAFEQFSCCKFSLERFLIRRDAKSSISAVSQVKEIGARSSRTLLLSTDLSF